MEVQLVFVGYTNYTKPTTNSTSVLTFNTSSAMVMASNSGNVAVELYLVTRPGREDLAWPSAWIQFGRKVEMEAHLPAILNPGETVLVEVTPQRLGLPWSTELMAQRRDLKDRLYVKAETKGSANVQRLVRKWLSPPPVIWPTLGPVTNAFKHRD